MSKEETKTVKTQKGTPGIPMSEESYKEWQKSFTDIEESIEGLDDN